MSGFLRVLVGFVRRVILIAVLLGVAVGVGLLFAMRSLPDLATPEQVVAQVGDAILTARSGLVRGAKTIRPFEVIPGGAQSPAGMALLAAHGCSSLLTAPAQPALAFRLELLKYWAGMRSGDAARCEAILARQLADFLHLEGSARLIAADRIHETLPHDTLLALWVSAYRFTPSGPFGLDEASVRFFDKPALKLDWNEASTLGLAAQDFDEAEACRNVPKLLARRATILDVVAKQVPTAGAAIQAAAKAPIPCDRPNTMLKQK